MRPEFVCRPPMGIGSPQKETALDLHPSEGPPGCVLLTVRHTSKEGRINEKGFGAADEDRYWLDPERDYIVMRWDMLVRDEAGNEQLHKSNTIEQVARSPSGVWYATKIRRHSPPNDKANGKRIDEVSHLYVDFDVELPDTFFDPPEGRQDSLSRECQTAILLTRRASEGRETEATSGYMPLPTVGRPASLARASG